MHTDRYILRLIIGVAILLSLLAFVYETTRAQDGSYIGTDVKPPDAQPWLGNRFWLQVNNAGVNETWLAIVAAYVVYDNGRKTEYMILRVDNLQNLADLDDPICPTINRSEHPYTNLPPPTIFIWDESTVQPYIHPPC